MSAGGEGRGKRRITARDLAAFTGGSLVGSADVSVAAVAPLDRAGADDLSFLAHRRYVPAFRQSLAGVVLCAPELATESQGPACRVVVAEPYVALLRVIPLLYPEPVWEAGVHPTAVIGPGARWEDPVAIGPHAVLGARVRLGSS